MNRIPLNSEVTEEFVRNLKYEGRIKVSLGSNLYIRFSKIERDGEREKTYIFQTNIVRDGYAQNYNCTIGSIRLVTLKRARELAKEFTKKAFAGERIEYEYPKLERKREWNNLKPVEEFDDAYIAALKKKKVKYSVPLNNFLRVFVFPSGYKSFYVCDNTADFYRCIGGADEITLAQAREITQSYIEAAKAGKEWDFKREKDLTTTRWTREKKDIEFVKALPIKKKQYTISIGGFLNVRVNSGGKKVYWLQKIVATGSKKKIYAYTLGDVDKITLEVARKEAMKFVKAVMSGDKYSFGDQKIIYTDEFWKKRREQNKKR